MLSPFRGMRFGRLEFASMHASRVMQVVLAAVAIIPLLYGALYLAAFYNPYQTFNDVSVAIVNEDKGAQVDGEALNVGDQIVDKLKDTDSGMQWNFVDAEQAESGLEDGGYYMVLTIPADFSEKVASASSDDPQQAVLDLRCNQAINMLATQIGQTMFEKVQTAAAKSVSLGYYQNIFGQISDGGETIQLAADGADTLAAGISSAASGSQTITTNLQSASDGASSLSSGLDTLSSGASKVDSGAGSLSSGAGTLSSGASSLSSGASALSSGANSLSSGTSSLSSGASALSSGISSVGTGVASVDHAVGDTTTTGTLAYGVNALYDGTGSLVSSTSELSTGASGVSSAVTAIESYAASASLTNDQKVAYIQNVLSQFQSGSGVSLSTAASSVASGVSTLATTAPALRAGIEQIYAGVVTGSGSTPSLMAGVSTLDYALNTNDGVTGNSLVADAAGMASGASSVSTGATSVASGAASAASGASQVSSGASTLASGADTLSSGTSSLVAGAASAASGANTLSSGLDQLADGSATLTQGLATAQSGSSQLADGLQDGADQLNDSTSGSDDKAAMMSDPISTDTSYYTTVENYGTGFAPYFISLGLWVGALILSLVCKPYNGRIVASNAMPEVAAWSGFLPMAAIGVVQAVLLGVVLQFVLGINIQHPVLFYAVLLLTVFVFIAILQLLSAAFGFPGKFIAIILLMLQLTSCAGTFPLETTPKFFQVISPYLPMTYSVSALRQAISGLDMVSILHSCIILAAFGIGCFFLTSLVVYRKRTVLVGDLHPLIQL